MSIFLSAEFLGYYTEALCVDSIFLSKPAFFYIFGTTFLAFAILDLFIFAFGPT